MKKTAISLLFGCVVVVVSAQDIEDKVRSDLMNEMNAVLEEWYKGNTSAYSALFAEEFQYYDPFSNEALANPTQLQEHYDKYITIAGVPYNGMHDPKFQQVDSTYVFSYRLVDEVKGMKVTWKATQVYANLDGSWKIINAHWSMHVDGLMMLPEVLVYAVAIVGGVILFVAGLWLGRVTRKRKQ